MSNLLGFLGAGGAACGVALAAGLPPAFACVLGLAVVGICLGVSSISKVDVPPVEPKVNKSKKEKQQLKKTAAAVDEDDAADAKADAKAAEKAAKKREKERARKVSKREAAAEAATEAAAAVAAAAAATAAAAAGTSSEDKKKKKKKKKKDSVKVDEEPEEKHEQPKEPEPVTSSDPWEEVKEKKKKKKVETVEAVGPEHTDTVTIDKKYFGLIIGPSGSTLRAIAEGTATTIEIPKDGSMHSEMIVITGSVGGCAKAKKTMLQLAAKGYSDLTHGSVTDASVNVPDKKRSLLIGPMGQTIKLIQEKLKVKINMPDKGSEDDVTVVGSDSDVQAALTCIKQLISQGYSDITHPSFVKDCMEIDRSQLGSLLGPKGSTIRALQDSTHVKINIEGSSVTVIGEPQDVQDAKVKIMTLIAVPEAVPIGAEWSKAASLHLVSVW